MSVTEAIDRANALLPGEPASEGEPDARWAAIIAVGEYLSTDPEAVWQFIERWGCSEDEDLQAAIACCLLEHLLEHHFDRYLARVQVAVEKNTLFACTTSMCWDFTESGEQQAAFRRLQQRAAERVREAQESGTLESTEP